MIRIECYSSVKDIPGIWNKFVSRKAVGLEIEHLKAIEISHINDLHPYYILGYNEEEVIGIAYLFSINIDLTKMGSNYPTEVISAIKIWRTDFMKVRVIEVGHIASLGTTIEASTNYMEDFLDKLTKKIDEIAEIEKAELCIIRDIEAENYCKYHYLEESGYKPALGFPIARLKLEWNSFDGYLSALKAKKRNNIKQKQSKLETDEITVEVIDDYAPYSQRLAELWNNVAKHQDTYEHEQLTPAYFQAMSQQLKGRSHVLAIKQNGEIVTFGLNLIGDEEYFGVAEGMDYSVRDSYDLYANMTFEAIRIACELGKKALNIGITSYDFKTSIGAELSPCIYFIKAFKEPGYSTVYADLIEKSIKQPENHHRAFKNDTSAYSYLPKEIKRLFDNKNNSLDPFTKHFNYIRADKVRAAGIYAFSPVFESSQEPVITHKGRQVIMLGTNSYLGLSTHPKIKEAAHQAIDKYGSGCSGSPMLNGTLDLHQQLSCELAQFLHKQDSLIFSTGYQTNVGVISALVNRDDVLIMDERNHASLVDGARLSRATLVRYKHNDTESLEAALKKFIDRPKLVITDSLFSMEGTIINLPEILRLTQKYDARLMIDESHAIGVMGPTGRGIAEYYGLLEEVDIIMGTFSKSFASIGGFISGNRKIIDTLKHTARSHIFSASLPPASVAVVLAAIKIIDEEPERRTRLLYNAKFFADGLKTLGYEICHSGSPIISLFCGNELLTVAAFNEIFDRGVFVNPVTSPAVPKNKEIIRISLMATHDKEMLLNALQVFKEIRTPSWPLMPEENSSIITGVS